MISALCLLTISQTFTAEARRQRNRDAQAAFRERRSEYIKELEQTVKIYADKLRSLEATRATTADECLMLRYKNYLLERILLYKGRSCIALDTFFILRGLK
jgi:hypothetical protein